MKKESITLGKLEMRDSFLNPYPLLLMENFLPYIYIFPNKYPMIYKSFEGHKDIKRKVNTTQRQRSKKTLLRIATLKVFLLSSLVSKFSHQG